MLDKFDKLFEIYTSIFLFNHASLQKCRKSEILAHLFFLYWDLSLLVAQPTFDVPLEPDIGDGDTKKPTLEVLQGTPMLQGTRTPLHTGAVVK